MCMSVLFSLVMNPPLDQSLIGLGEMDPNIPSHVEMVWWSLWFKSLANLRCIYTLDHQLERYCTYQLSSCHQRVKGRTRELRGFSTIQYAPIRWTTYSNRHTLATMLVPLKSLHEATLETQTWITHRNQYMPKFPGRSCDSHPPHIWISCRQSGSHTIQYRGLSTLYKWPCNVPLNYVHAAHTQSLQPVWSLIMPCHYHCTAIFLAA